MTSSEIARRRLTNQMVVSSPCKRPGDVVRAMGAVQAQDYLGSLWAVGARMITAQEGDIEKAIAGREIVRTWPMRGTLHLVCPEDVHWMLEHLAPRVIAAAAGRHRQLELDDAVFARSEKVFIRALRGGKALTRREMMALLEASKIQTANQRGYHILWRLALGGVLCCGPRIGKQQSFVLLQEWIPSPTPRRSREEVLADFALRYFTSHGPATLEDFVWWSGLKKSDAVKVLDSISLQLERIMANDSTYWLSPSAPVPRGRPGEFHLLPSFDELLLGYSDRSDAVPHQHTQEITPGTNGLFSPVIVKSGRVVGTWKRTFGRRDEVSLTPEPFATFTKTELRAWSAAAERYLNFLGARTN